eukprot:334294_1
MATQCVVEGSATNSEMQQWLYNHKIDVKYTEAIEAMGVKSTDDLKLIANKDEFQGLLDEIANYLSSKNMNLTYMDRIKLKKAWKRLMTTQPNKSQIIPMGPKERDSLELLATYMQFIQKQMIILDECINGSQLEKYCDQIRNQSKLLQQNIKLRENQLIEDAKNKFNEISQEYKIKQKTLELLAVNMNNIKKKCDNALQMNEYNQLQERRHIICNSVQSIQKSMDDVMTQTVESYMKTVKLDLNDKVVQFGQVFIQLPFDIGIETVTMNYCSDKYDFKVMWKIKNGNYLYENCDNLTISIIKQDNDQKVNDEEQKENVIISKRVQCDLSKYNFAELTVNKNELKENCILIFKINVLNKMVQKQYQCKLNQPLKFIGYVEWFQDKTFSCKQEDDAMNKACNDKFKGCRAATDSEVIEGKIQGLVKWTSEKAVYIFAHSGGNDLWKDTSYKNGNREFGRHCWYNKWPLTAQDYSGSGCWYGNDGLTIAVTTVFCLTEM